MPTLGTKSKRDVQEYIKEIYSIAHDIAPINYHGTDSPNKDWKAIYRMAHLSNAITRDFMAACSEVESLKAILQEDKMLKKNKVVFSKDCDVNKNQLTLLMPIVPETENDKYCVVVSLRGVLERYERLEIVKTNKSV